MFPAITLHDIRVVARLCDYSQVLYTWQISRATERVLKMFLGFVKSTSEKKLATSAGISSSALLQTEAEASIFQCI